MNGLDSGGDHWQALPGQMSENGIKVVGIRPRPGSVGPPGLHLRWTFPPAAGFPQKGFEVFRRPNPKKQDPADPVSTAQVACLEDWGPPVATLPLVADAEAAKSRLEPGLANRYAADISTAVQRYTPELPALVDWLWLLQTPHANAFANPGAPPDQLRLRHTDPDAPVRELAPQSILLLSALDPNIARFLSLYWVDADGAPGGPSPGEGYDYKVVGSWLTHQSCGVLFNVGGAEAALPSAVGTVAAEQLPGLRWVGTDPRGRVGVGWPRPGESTVTAAVLFDVGRDGPDSAEVLLTLSRPVLVPAHSWLDPRGARFIDTAVTLSTYRYRVRGIDLFGQVGAWLDQATVTVRDLEAPPPPVRLRAAISAANRFRLRFEYGAFQHLQAPDSATFTVYWRPDSLFTDVTAEVEVIAETRVGEDLRVYEVRLITNQQGGCLAVVFPWLFGPNLQQLPRFAHGYLTNVLKGAERLPAADRRRFRIAEVIDDRRMRLAPTSAPLTPGRYRIVSDPHAVQSWRKLTSAIEVRAPIAGEITTVEKPVSVAVTVRAAREIPARPDALAMLPAGHGPPGSGGRQAQVELLLDRTFLDADLFAGCTARLGNRTVQSLYWVPGLGFDDDPSPAHGQTARLSLPADAAPVSGQTLDLEPRVDTRWVTLKITAGSTPGPIGEPGGELAFFEPGDEGAPTLRVARVISGAEPLQDGFRLLVRASASVRAGLERRPGVQARYFAPYAIDGPVDLANANAEGVALPIPPDDGARQAYLAVSTVDVRGNEGALSVPAQITAVRQAPAGAPTRPYPCDLGALAEAGYLSPPDTAGRATVCLAWGRGTLDSTDGLRFDVGRALDNGIIATDRRNWMLARAGHDPGLPELPVLAQGEATGRIDPTPRPTTGGLFRLEVVDLTDPQGAAVGVDADLVRRLSGGRLVSDGRTFQITKTALDGVALQLIARPLVQTSVPATGPCRLAVALDYTRISSDSAALARLAEKPLNQDAFGLVTGVPIDKDRFRDEMPGIGRNRFFYRVRAVDAAENRSAWSPVSVPFHQADTSPAESPDDLTVLGGDRTAVLSWSAVPDPRVVGYRVYRAHGPDTELSGYELVAELAKEPTGGQAALEPERLSVQFGGVAFPPSIPLPANLGTGPPGPHLTGVYRLSPDGSADLSVDYVARQTTSPDNS